MRRSFRLEYRPRRARVYLAALGVGDLWINGGRVEAGARGSEWTDYRSRVAYQTLDVTNTLVKGANVLGVLLADGWYAGAIGGGRRQVYGERPALRLELHLEFPNGQHQIVCSDERWRWRLSHILRADAGTGESVDGRQWSQDWADAGAGKASWQPVEILDGLDLEMTPSPLRAACAVRALRPAEPLQPEVRPGSNRWLVDFRQSLYGAVEVGLAAGRGDHVRVRCAETEDGFDHILESHYTVRGDGGREAFVPRCSAQGFRYAEVVSDGSPTSVIDVQAMAFGTPADATGEFLCDHPLLNQLHSNLAWTARNTLQDTVYSGTGHDERYGRLSELYGGLNGATLCTDLSSRLAHWCEEVARAELPDGGYPDVVPPVPHQSFCPRVAGLSEVFIHAVWARFRHYGALSALATSYPAIRRLVFALEAQSPGLIRSVPASANPFEQRSGPADLLCTAVFFEAVARAAAIARLLGHLADADSLLDLAARIKAAFRQRFVTAAGELVGNTQSAYALALDVGLLDAAGGDQALARLVDLLLAAQYHMDVDPLLSGRLLPLLTRHGRMDLAYQLMLQVAKPSLLADVRAGATVLRDAQGRTRAALLGVAEWLYGDLVGIRMDDAEPTASAYRRVVIRPRPPLGVAFAEGPSIRYAAATLDTVSGRFELEWEIAADAFVLRVTLPPSCYGIVHMPDNCIERIGPGRHELSAPFEGSAGEVPILRETYAG